MPPRLGEPSPVPFLETVLRWSPAPSPPPLKKRKTRKVRKPYMCDLCPMAFQRPSALESSLVNFPAFVCENCGSAFSYKTNLTRHGHGCPQEDGSEEPSTSFASASNNV
ncbi:hypothetical protein BS47DRAFT_1352311 [Hydnum rufescens UP504]|uniref:C2H2-type domain-containing protein n=1 Tax=Hydnum rufescens UP504 TaxID=1448309 RepID=A0A9P6DQ38_9AGAM|nr:hypothetical protein BS47DRAFT_1352311 [Hydnum rufescens UP504]